MSKTVLNTGGAPQPAGPYSQGIISNGFLFTAGIGPQDPVTGEVSGGIEEQTRRVLRSIESVLQEAGASLADVAKTTVHLQHLTRDFGAFNAVYAEFFAPPYPVRTTVGSDLYGILVEIDVTAVVPADADGESSGRGR